MADGNHTTEAKRLTRGSLFGEECRIRKTYGCSLFGARIWLRYARVFGLPALPVAAMVAKSTRAPLANLHGETCSHNYYARKRISYNERLAREAQAREERGEESMLLKRQAV